MIFAASLLLAQAVAAAPPEPPPENEIVVLGRRLAETRVDWTSRRRDGAIQIRRCRVTKSSGDKGLDRLLCQAVRECAPHIPYDAPEGDTFSEFYACADKRRLELAQALFVRRESRR